MNTDKAIEIIAAARSKGERINLYQFDLRWADLREADLREANLRRANLQGVDLRKANLQEADLRRADLRGADLREADLRRANLQGADLRKANLQEADLDFAVWPLWCGTKNVKVDRRIAAQLAAHFCALDCDDKEYLAARSAIMAFAQSSHRAEDLGLEG